MYLSELYGRIGQILREHGDMRVVRHRSLKIDGIIKTELNDFINFSSSDFYILENYKQKQIGEKTVEKRKVNQHFVINIPLE